MHLLRVILIGVGFCLPLAVLTVFLMKLIHTAQIYFNRKKTEALSQH